MVCPPPVAVECITAEEFEGQLCRSVVESVKQEVSGSMKRCKNAQVKSCMDRHGWP